MKATGIVRRVDELGRVVIPKEIRRMMHLREGDLLEIFTNREGEVIFKKYSPLGEIGEFAKSICESLAKTYGKTAAVCDRDMVIAVSGIERKFFADKPVSTELSLMMDMRQQHIADGKTGEAIPVFDGDEHTYAAQAAMTILSEGEPIGAILMFSTEPNAEITESDVKGLNMAKQFIGKTMKG